MDKVLKPEKLDVDLNTSAVEMRWHHWYRTFSNYLTAIEDLHSDRLNTLMNHVSPAVYEHFARCGTHDAAIDVLLTLYVKPRNEMYVRHLLATRNQEAGEMLDQYLQALRGLHKDCNFQAVTVEQN